MKFSRHKQADRAACLRYLRGCYYVTGDMRFRDAMAAIGERPVAARHRVWKRIDLAVLFALVGTLRQARGHSIESACKILAGPRCKKIFARPVSKSGLVRRYHEAARIVQSDSDLHSHVESSISGWSNELAKKPRTVAISAILRGKLLQNNVD